MTTWIMTRGQYLLKYLFDLFVNFYKCGYFYSILGIIFRFLKYSHSIVNIERTKFQNFVLHIFKYHEQKAILFPVTFYIIYR